MSASDKSSANHDENDCIGLLVDAKPNWWNSRNRYPAFLVHAEILNSLWNSADQLFIPKWTGGPRKDWFCIQPEYSQRTLQDSLFKPGDAGVEVRDGREFLRFKNGRHRTRWLLQLGIPHVPLGVEKECIPRAAEIGLLVSQALHAEIIFVPSNALDGASWPRAL